MSTSINVFLRHLAAADIDRAPRVGAVNGVDVWLGGRTQLHWDSFAAFETWVDVLVQRVYEAQQANEATAVAS